jgi:soluble lytic murein transglycosylase
VLLFTPSYRELLLIVRLDPCTGTDYIRNMSSVRKARPKSAGVTIRIRAVAARVAVFVFSLAFLGLSGLLPQTCRALTLTTGPMQEYVFVEGKKHYDSGDVIGAEKVWKTILPDTLFGPPAHILLARAYRKSGHLGHAETILKQLSQNHPHHGYDALATDLLAEVLAEQGKPEAVPLLTSMTQTATDKNKSALLLKLAQLEKRLRNYPAAADHFRKLYLEQPASIEGLKAGEELGWMVFHHKMDPPVYSEKEQLLRADRLYAKGRFDLAAEVYQALLKSNPSDKGLLIKLARCRYRDRRNNDAITLLKEVLRGDVSEIHRLEALHLLSLVYWRLDRERDFEAVSEKILAQGSGKIKLKALYNLAAFNFERNRLAKAETYFDRFAKTCTDPSQKANAKWKMAWIKFRQQKYKDAAQLFRESRSLAKSGGFGEASRYWQARSLVLLKQPKDAEPILKEIVRSAPLDYYAFEASRLLKSIGAKTVEGNEPQKPFPDIKLTPAQKLDHRVADAMKLMEKGLHEFALIKLDALPNDMKSSPSVAFLAAEAAYGAGKYGPAQKILTDQFGKFMENPPRNAPSEFIEIAFPRVHPAATTRHAKKHSINPHLIWAIIRQESRYDPAVVSPAGALGLMQVTPGAAGHAEKGGKIPAKAIAEMLDPDKNLALGTKILAKNLTSFKGNVVYAVAAYNADINKVREWVRKNAKMKQDEFIETIPYLETRLYVKKVLAGYGAYNRLHLRRDLAGLW